MIAKQTVIGMILFENFTSLDFIGPYEVFSRFPEAKILLLSKTLSPVKSEAGLCVMPDTLFSQCPQLDLLFVPGGSGINATIVDSETQIFIKKQAKQAKYLVSVCTGSLLLAACGLLRGYRATTHWASLHFLAEFAAIPVSERFVVDRNRFTGGGITAGIDLALKVAHELYGEETAKSIQLMLEYDPKPEFAKAGSPLTADKKTVEYVRGAMRELLEDRKNAVSQAKKMLAENQFSS